MLQFRQDERTKGARIVKATPWRRQIIDTDAGGIETLDNGAGQNRAILLVTHGLGSIHSAEEIAEGLNARFPGRRIIAYSRPGRGASPECGHLASTDPLSQEAHALLPALLRALGLTSVDIVAHSDGVAVAVLFASAHPWMVGRMVAICPQVHTPERVDPSRCVEDIEKLGADHTNTLGAIRCWSAQCETLTANPGMVLDRVGALTAPLLLIQGLKDEYGAQRQMEALSDRVHGPMKWVMLRHDGHFPQHDNADVVIDMICGHFGDLSSETTSKRRQRRGAI
ncbi:pimeloyl-ACP methyl ester carboxylesterase [Rhizobium aquaticum]|uniref:Pimeloyl-ACP methyl ester carboxylesterase n=1 Tax=Rhizobium aquaticum TaxID=1549636 RepID=A0ABV2IT85_9HYPH